MNEVGISLDVEDCLLKLFAYGGDGFEGIVLENLLANFIPEILLWI